MMVDITLFSIKNSRKYDLTIIRGAFTFEPLFIGFLKFLGVFRCKTWVTADTGGSRDEIILLKNWKFSKIFIFFAKQHDYFNSICESNTLHYRELGFDKNKMTFIKNGVEIPPIPKNNVSKIRNFLYLGRLEEVKGIKKLLDEFLEVLRQFPETKLTIGGDGSLKEYLLNFISTRNLNKKIIYKGLITRNEKDKFFALGDCLILPSHSEAFALVVYEALLRGKNVISTDVDDIKKDLGNMVYYFDIDKEGDLKLKVSFVIGKQVKINSLEKIAKSVDIHEIVNQILELI
jgi:glycosyltransferase involved in cell wall biosynthesis